MITIAGEPVQRLLPVRVRRLHEADLHPGRPHPDVLLLRPRRRAAHSGTTVFMGYS